MSINKLDRLNENFPIIKEITSKVNEYQEKYRHPNLKKFEIYEGLYDLYPQKDSLYSEYIRGDYSNEWPHNLRAGVYFIFSSELNLLYIGKSSNAIGGRLYSHYNSVWKQNKPRYVLTVAVQESFEASSLEEFLIKNIKTEYNSALTIL